MVTIIIHDELLNKNYVEDTLAIGFNDKGVGYELTMMPNNNFKLYQLSGTPDSNETIDQLESDFYRSYAGEVTAENISAYITSLF